MATEDMQPAAAEGTLAGSEAIPDGMANSPHGDVTLEYTLQNFNALVAANTAMQTEISSLLAAAVERQGEIDHLREVIAESLKPAIASLTKITNDQEQMIRKYEEKYGQRKEELQFVTEQRDAIQRRLDRTLGYLDRTLDDDDAIRAPATQTVPAPAPAVGPNFDDIHEPRRRRDGDQTMFATARIAEGYSPSQRRRRYS